ncbi:MAG TPA: PAS domain-containing protein [Rhizomicrobium sp.]|nr:PAS domain-containing protein [Rhizomicrobium sp.]
MPELTNNPQFFQGQGFFAALVESAIDGVIVTDLTGIIRGYNQAAERLFGHLQQQALGQNISILLPPDRLREEENLAREILAGHNVRFETVCRHKDGSEIPVLLSAAPIQDNSGRIVGTVATVRDLRHEKAAGAKDAALEAELTHVSRLSAMGEMSAAIAHELNQPLTAVTNYVKAALRFLNQDPPTSMQIHNACKAMEKAADQTIRAGTIIRYLRDFVEKRESERAPENINQVIRDAVTLGLVGTDHSNIKVKLELESRIPRLMIDKIQIQQVFLNLIRNAAEAMAGSENAEIVISSSAVDSSFAQIEIRDTGPGFAPEMAGKLFQAFATTKRDGLGIGLKICQSIVEAHGGSIKALRDGPGAGFQIRLPLV